MSNEQRGRSAKAAGDAWERALDACHARLSAALRVQLEQAERHAQSEADLVKKLDAANQRDRT